MSQFIHPLCNECGAELAGKIGTALLVCVGCEREFDVTERE